MKAVIVWCIIAFLTLVFAVASCIRGPHIDPPTHMRSSDPPWYSGE